MQEERRKAKEKAERLLRICLTEEQQKMLDEQSAFLVEAESKKCYKIERGRTGNVKEIDGEGKPVARYCIHPSLTVPNADTMLAQKLMLETDEREFLRIANRTVL